MTTRAEVRRLVRAWQRRLKLTHYKIDVVFDDFGNAEVGADTGTFATVKVHSDYDVARLTVNTLFVMWDEKVLNVVIVHELLHIHENGVGVTVEALEEILETDAYKLLDARYNHEVESLIERLATIIVELGGCA